MNKYTVQGNFTWTLI